MMVMLLKSPSIFQTAHIFLLTANGNPESRDDDDDDISIFFVCWLAYTKCHALLRRKGAQIGNLEITTRTFIYVCSVQMYTKVSLFLKVEHNNRMRSLLAFLLQEKKKKLSSSVTVLQKST